MPNLTRRSLFMLGGTGAAGLAVAGCGEEDDPRADSSHEEILGRAAAAEAAFGAGLSTAGTKPEIAQFEQASSARQQTLTELGAASREDTEPTASDPIAAASAAIAAYREGVRLLSTTELRATAIQFLTEVSAEQAALRGLEDEDQSPVAFVTGLEEEPYVASEDEEDEDGG